MNIDVKLTKKQANILTLYSVQKKLSDPVYNYTAVTLQVLNVKKHGRFDNPAGVATALYFAAHIVDERITQKECAELAEVSTSTINQKADEVFGLMSAMW
jgi:transcription initiation factor TFIIIB Brf1 subunit/transcription initiation factor TFIIB